MRADRLVATLLLLQTKGRVTAAEVAAELEISERTARRDLEALSLAGIPVYSQQGRGGGWSLIGGARTDLTGLTAPEARALFLVAGPSSVATPELKAALRKLVGALPEPMRRSAEAASTAVVVDPASWGEHATPPPPHLTELQHAVVEGLQVVLAYEDRQRNATERVVHPLGLIAKGGVWYLVADTANGMRTFRVNRVRAVTLTDDPVVRPDGFDLVETWNAIAADVEEKRTPFRTRATIRRHELWYLWGTFGNRLTVTGDVDAEVVEIELRGHGPEALAAEIAGFGSAIDVEDTDVRRALARIGAELTAAFG
ncbi:MAG TPA: WYL domain-containing protein [Acidimicrobiales bacterium]|nr:WYL domain-containing protein [Acidimicrobiales bacterium]